MCACFGACFQYRELKVQWNLLGDIPLFGPRYNIAPSQDVPVIVRNESRNELRTMRWGLVPSWAQDKSIGQGMINARAETLLEKPSFKQLVSTRRCLVPARRQPASANSAETPLDGSLRLEELTVGSRPFCIGHR
jgi:putative SOS response-associated peptidase YedK